LPSIGAIGDRVIELAVQRDAALRLSDGRNASVYNSTLVRVIFFIRKLNII
jgi:hypothetical protein